MGGKRHWHVRILIALSVFTIASPVIYVSDAAAEIDEIVVTATKRDERLRDAPLSVSVLTSSVLEDADVRDLLDVAGLVPSFDIAQSTGPLSTSLFIRRIGNLGSIPNFESAVGTFVDGAFRVRAAAVLGDLFDLRQVEIARGPQTTMHGKNTTAGLVSIATNPPSDKFELRGRVHGGVVDAAESANLVRFEGVINVPMSSSMSFRAGGVVYEHDETLLNLFNGDHSQDAKRFFLRAQLGYSNSKNLEARLIANRFRVNSAKLGDLVLFEGNTIKAINAGSGVPCPDHSVNDRLFCRNHASVFELTSGDVTLNLRADIGETTLHSISSFEDYESSRDFDADQLNIDVVRIIDRQQGLGFSQELRLVGGGGAGVGWIVGAFYLDSEFHRGDASEATAILGPDAPNLELLPGLPVGTAGDSGFFQSDSDTRHLSVFAQVDWPLNDAFSVRAGLRWQSEGKRTTIINTTDHAGPSVITLQLMPAFADAALSRDTSGVSWELSGRYRWSDALMGYLLASHGFKSGGFNASFGATPPGSREFGDEKVDNIELGFKSVLRDGRVRFNAALFAARYEDYQSAGWVSLRFLVNNAERVDMHGIEFDLQSSLGKYFTAGASLSWVDARYDHYTNGSCYFNRPPDNPNGTACDLSGETLPLAPRTRANIDLTFEQAIRSGSLYARLDWSYTSQYSTNSTLDPRHMQEAYSLVDLHAGYRFGRFEIAGWVRNMGDELVVMREGPSNLFPRDPAYGRAFAMPRSYGLTLSARL